MKTDLTCGVVRDLLPSYADGIAGEETAAAVERHMAECEDCRAALHRMKEPEDAAPPEEKSRSEKEKAPPTGRSTPERKRAGRPDGRTHAAARQRQKAQARVRFEGSRPVKKGKGSGRKDP